MIDANKDFSISAPLILMDANLVTATQREVRLSIVVTQGVGSVSV